MIKPIVDVVIPTWNNPEFFNPCMRSICQTTLFGGLGRVIVVNNGRQPIKQMLAELGDKVLVLDPGKNLGWEGGLKLGLEHSEAPFVVFQNDDVFIPQSSQLFYNRLLYQFNDDNVAAVGPTTTTASGMQSIFHPNSPISSVMQVTYLIFFTVMIRRRHLDEVGGVDTTLPGGDDLDLSIRFRKANKKLIVTPDAFLIHHGFKTGTRVRGDGYAGVKNGWNSPEMIERTNRHLIRKHGFKEFIQTMYGSYPTGTPPDDLEANLVRSYVPNHGSSVVELGCGFRKTIPDSIGVDRILRGENIPHVPGGQSVADVNADVQEPLPFEDGSKDVVIARHILEHCLDPIKTIRQWARIIKPGGRIVIAVPDQKVTNGIPLNPEHCHAFEDKSLKTLMETCGFKEVESKSANNGVSFVGVYEKC